MKIPREEHPKPQFERKSWMNLNGTWEFEIDHGCSGFERGYAEADHRLNSSITVPFCPEAKLSGVQYRDFMLSVWYRRTVMLSGEQLSGHVFLHFGAVDHECDVYVNGKHAGGHRGGYVSFAVDVTPYVAEGENVITVWARDDTRDPMIPRGKQSELYYSHRCDYTRTTGIWQTVWLEFVPKTYVKTIRMESCTENSAMILTADLSGMADLLVEATYEGCPVGTFSAVDASGQVKAVIPLSEKHLWEPGNGRLYDIVLHFGSDEVKTYFGLRSLKLTKEGFYINGKKVFQRLILDQGFYPDGVYTAPSDKELEADIRRSMAMGFNGARLHEKVFEERFLYHADRLGYLVWGEYPGWGLDHTRPESIYGILPEWLEEVKRDYNHPAIIGWCPFNETWDKHGCRQDDAVIHTVYLATKAADITRPCIDTSGNFHVETDIYDVHDYEQDPAVFKEHYDTILQTGVMYSKFEAKPTLRHGDCKGRQHHGGEPVMITEFGGIKWSDRMASPDSDKESWGYGKKVESREEFQERFKGLCDAILDNPCILGFCYTQLTDVEQEQNGLYTYDRKPKFDAAWVKSVVSRPAACEKRP